MKTGNGLFFTQKSRNLLKRQAYHSKIVLSCANDKIKPERSFIKPEVANLSSNETMIS